MNSKRGRDFYHYEPAFTPYVGPRSFDVSEAAIFFGRSREICQIVNLIYVNQVLLLYSQPGAGKSSLLRAGVIPRLTADGFKVLPLGRVAEFVPQDIEPKEIQNIFVFNYLLSSLETKADLTTLTRETLAKHLKELERPLDNVGQPAPRALIFDQFEELFISHQDRWQNRQDFFEQVHQALDSDHLLRVVFALREEYIGEMEHYVHLLPDEFSARFRLERLRKADALRAVSAPLSMTRQHFAEGVAEKIVFDLMRIRVPTAKGEIEVEGEFIEPVQLQVVMSTLWQEALHLGVEVLTADLLDSSDAALSSFYDSVVHEVVTRSPEISEEMLRNLFDKSLITPEGTRAVAIRGEMETAGIPNYVMDKLQNGRLIRAEHRRGIQLYELTHDRIISPIRESNRRFFQSSKLASRKN